METANEILLRTLRDILAEWEVRANEYDKLLVIQHEKDKELLKRNVARLKELILQIEGEINETL